MFTPESTNAQMRLNFPDTFQTIEAIVPYAEGDDVRMFAKRANSVSTPAGLDDLWRDLLAATGINPYIDGDGLIFDLNDGSCPRCKESATAASRSRVSGYFDCPNCNVMFDEPRFAEPSLGCLD